MRKFVNSYIDGIILFVALVSTCITWHLNKDYEANEYEIYYIAFTAITFCPFAVTLQKMLNRMNFFTISMFSVFTLNFVGALLGFTIRTKGFAEIMIMIAMIAMVLFITDKKNNGRSFK